jgi:hypothetical protein
MPSLYRSLLYLYPPTFRDEYGEEMLAVLSEVDKETRKKSLFIRVARGAHEAGGLFYGALHEHARAVLGDYRGEMFSSRRIRMRSEFRFPKAALTLMTIILVAVIMVIEKAKAIQESVTSQGPAVGPIRPDVTVLPTFAIVLVSACVAAAIGWAILFALRRSGVQRLSELNPSTRQHSGSGSTV